MNLALLSDTPASILPEDEPLFKKLGIKPYIRVPANIERLVGTAVADDVTIDIHVTPGPVTSWRVAISDLLTGEKITLRTGTGPLKRFWHTIELLAAREMRIQPAQRLSA